jgi:hypothetical protein
MDVHVPRPITRALRKRGVDVITAQEDGTARWNDPELLDRAGKLDRVCFRKMKICSSKRRGGKAKAWASTALFTLRNSH